MDLKKLRKQFGLSQVAMSKEIGVPLVTYLNWEYQVATPNEENQIKIDACIERLTAKKGEE